MRKKYLKVRDKQTGAVGLAHRQVASTLLGRPLLPGEVVHHLNGDSTNNAPENLLVLSSQRFHAHIEHVLRQERRGQPYLFPELLRSIRQRPRGSLFEHLAVESSAKISVVNLRQEPQLFGEVDPVRRRATGSKVSSVTAALTCCMACSGGIRSP